MIRKMQTGATNRRKPGRKLQTTDGDIENTTLGTINAIGGNWNLNIEGRNGSTGNHNDVPKSIGQMRTGARTSRHVRI